SSCAVGPRWPVPAWTSPWPVSSPDPLAVPAGGSRHRPGTASRSRQGRAGPGVTGAAAVAGPVPIALIAATLKVYVWPGVRPPTTVNGVRAESAHSAIRPVNATVGTPGAVISYPRIGAPPVFAGGRQRTDTASVPTRT